MAVAVALAVATVLTVRTGSMETSVVIGNAVLATTVVRKVFLISSYVAVPNVVAQSLFAAMAAASF